MNDELSEISLLKEKIAAHMRTNQLPEAEALLKVACNQEQTDADLWKMYANIQYAKGDYALMEMCCREVVNHRPDDVDWIFNLGCALVANNKAKEAEHYFELVIKVNPGHSVAHDNLGQLYEERGLLDKAGACYENAIHGDNVQGIHYRHLGVICLKSKNPEQAEKYFLKGMDTENIDAKAHVELGRAQCELGKIDEATKSFNQALHINPELNYARFWLSAINDQCSTDAAKHRFVSRLFDGHAQDFDKILVDGLGYEIPWLVAEELQKLIGASSTLDILDIGCGTGLCAVSLGSMTNTIVGIDLSGNMLVKARERGLYKDLIQGDIVEAMDHLNDKFNLVIAADVFVYVGGLSEAFRACNSMLNEGGFFAFSTELSDHHDGYMLRATGRYAHSVNYISKLAAKNNFNIRVQRDVLLRMDSGSEIRGMMFILCKGM